MANQTTPAIQVKDSNVGIGTATPSYKLQIAEDTYARIALHQTTTGAIWNWGNDGSNMYAYYTNTGVRALDITNTGNVGIGTTSPFSKLTVSGTLSSSTSQISIVNTEGGHAIIRSGIAGVSNNGISFITASVDGSSQVNRMVIDASGNVGIGTSSPTAKLQVEGDGIVINTENVAGAKFLYFRYSNGGDVRSDSFLTFSTSSSPSEKMRITAAGNVGIGTTNPYSGTNVRSLDINAAAYPVLSLSVGGTNVASLVGFSSSVSLLAKTGNYITLNPNDTEAVRITTAGNVGIGTTSPSVRLDVVGGNSAEGQLYVGNTNVEYSAGINFTTSGTNRGFVGWRHTYSTAPFNLTGIHLFNTDNSNIVFGTNNLVRAVIDTNGNVGIGTTAPNAPLHIVKDLGTSTSAVVRLRGSNSTARTTRLQFEDYNGTIADGLIDFIIPTAGSSTGARLDIGVDSSIMSLVKGGNVGIGTTAPGALLHVSQSSANTVLRVGNNSNYDQYILFNGGNDWSMGMDYSNSNAFVLSNYSSLGTNDRIVVTTGGNVGIGTTSPSYKLQVNAEGNGLYVIGANSAPYTQTIAKFVYGGNSNSINIENQGGKASFQARDSSDNAMNLHLNPVGGNVGIGTASPTEILNIARTGTDNYIKVEAGGQAANYSGIMLTEAGINWGWSLRHSAGTDLLYISYQDNTPTFSDVVTFTRTGNVGIGTTAPSTKLEVYAGSDSTSNTILWGETIRNAGNGGTSGYGVGLKLKNSTDSSNEVYKWAGVSAVAGINYSDRTDLAFYTNAGVAAHSTEKVRITGDGNLGVGTIAPGSPLSVAGTGGSTLGTNGYLVHIGGTDGNVDPVRYMIGFSHGNTYTAGNVRAAVGMMVTTGGAGNLVFETGSNGAGQAERMRINGSGNVGIGTTSPQSKLHIETSASNPFRMVRGTTNFGFEIGGGAIGLYDYEDVTYRWYVDSVGNVGIGTTSPSYKLDVVGDSRITSGSLGVGVAPNATDGRIDASNDIVAFQTSDRRLKENITPITNALDKVKSLTGVEFDWKEETKHVHGYEGHDTGIIAQQVQAVMPTAVRTNDTGYLSVRYEKLISLLIEANKELAARVEELESKLK